MYLATILQPLLDVNNAILRFWHNSAGFSWGLSIVFLTFCVRLVILPLTFKQVRSMQALQRLQPEMKKLQERYKGDKPRLNQELMKFYQEHKVNPLGSCLPLILQLPFFFSLFYLLRSSEFKDEIAGGEKFFFIPNLAEPVKHHTAVLITLMVLYVATQLGSSLVTAMSADPNQRRIMLAIPFIFVFFIINFRAGLILYWITTNVWTIGQQLFVKKFLPAPDPFAPKEDASDGGREPVAAGKRLQPRRAAVASGAGDGGNGGAAKAPPPSPRKKKKRSGRRR